MDLGRSHPAARKRVGPECAIHTDNQEEMMLELKSRRELDAHLEAMVERLVSSLVSKELGIREGTVMSLAGSVPYRRLDCDGRALCYIRCRPQKKAVRIDVSGLWRKPAASKLALHGASGSLTLLVSQMEDVEEAASYLRSVVSGTRALSR
jgi:hypothetical protein